MDNYINYYYHLYPEKINNKDDIYDFILDDEKYYFLIYDRNLNDIDYLHKLNKEMLGRNSLVHEIILNKDKKVVTMVNDVSYVLMKVYINEYRPVNLAEINFINMSSENIDLHKSLDRTDWPTLWSNKIDYFEYQISQVGKKYPILSDSLGYFIGLGENAIAYAKNTMLELKPTIYDKITISHRRIKANHTMLDLYNPLSFVIDYKVRDLSEYIKESFFADKDIWSEIDEYFKHNYVSLYSLRLLYARLLYPSYYFDLFEDIMDGKRKEEDILIIISKINKYEQFLNDFYAYISVGNFLPPITWLNKKTINK